MSVKLDHLNIDLDGDGIPERYELGGGGNANEREISWEDYKNLSEEEQNNGTTYYVPDAPGGGSGGSSGGSNKYLRSWSTEEHEISVDNEGNVVYEKTFVRSRNDLSSIALDNINLLDMDTIVESTWGKTYGKNGYVIGNTHVLAFYKENERKINFAAGGWGDSFTIYVRITYTKTTD